MIVGRGVWVGGFEGWVAGVVECDILRAAD